LGGGMFINAYDMGRSASTHAMRTATHSPTNGSTVHDPDAGAAHLRFMNWFLNTDGSCCRAPRRRHLRAIGNGANMIFVDAEHDLVAVARWIDGGAMDASSSGCWLRRT